ncbi:acyl-CoA dehydrogenase family protein [Actinomadura rugatobispora]|uniref:Acyl-CoA dehydrogenase family protein n=1 Tax=Actinomadura rugatobispora TaxID=1994 RepID=A0ABW1AIN3_9ACTN|nr:hypothetical protein GCM10010200_079820 [Actinomadura rugatobispora]
MRPLLAEGADDAFVDAASRALRAGDGGDPLTSLGWWDLLTELADLTARQAALALFRAQGRELADSAALGALMAQPFLDLTGLSPGKLVAAIPRRSARRGERLVVVGDVAGRSLLIDRPGHGADVVAADEVELRTVAVAGRLTIREIDREPPAAVPAVPEDRAAPARARGRFLGRIAAALEILGAAEAGLLLAAEHAAAREQFGRPIGTFQAVRHLLAWALTDLAAVDGVTATAVRLDGDTPPRHDQVVKALAGRNGRRVCQRTLQVLGAIGFTAEHDHHHFHSRVLALDALLGTSTELTHGLGTWVRETRTDPALPAAALLRRWDS